MRQRSGMRVVAVLSIAASLGGCATQQHAVTERGWHDPNLITREDIERTGATNAFDALRRSHTYLSVSEVRGSATITHDFQATSRGRSSFLLSPQVLLVVDDVMRLDVASLREIPADNVAWIRVMTAMQATPIYGTEGGNGAIVVKTRVPQDD